MVIENSLKRSKSFNDVTYKSPRLKKPNLLKMQRNSSNPINISEASILENRYLILRTVSHPIEKEMRNLTNQRSDINVLTTPSTAIFPNGTQYLTISSIQIPEAAKKKWGGFPNLIFIPTIKDTESRTGTTLVLQWPACLHTCGTDKIISKYDSENKEIKKPLHTRFRNLGNQIKDNWRENVDGKGIYGKYSPYCLHESLQGTQLYQKGINLLRHLEYAIPQKGATLREYVVSHTNINISPEAQKEIFKSQEDYVFFLKNKNKNDPLTSTKITEAVEKYQSYLKENPNTQESYFEIIGDILHQEMQQEILEHYENYTHNGLLFNEFTGRLFPWEIEGLEIGYVQDLNDKKEIISKTARSRKYITDIQEKRKEILQRIEEQGIQHPLIQEFITAKNEILIEQEEKELTEDEKNKILKTIKEKMKRGITSYSYQKGKFQSLNLPEDLENTDKPKIKTLTQENFTAISNRLRKTAGLKEIQYNTHQYIEDKEDDLLPIARKAVRAFLDTNIDFKLTGSKEDSGGLALYILKQKNPNLLDREIASENLNALSLDSCISIISSACYSDDIQKEKYENNKPSEITLESQNIVSSILPYGINVFHSYADKHSVLNSKRPLCDFSVPVYSLPLENMHQETQNNLIEAWKRRNDAPFKHTLEEFFVTIKEKYAVDLSEKKQCDDIKIVWNDIRQIENKIFGIKHNHEITQTFFNTLGGNWSKSKDIADEENSFRKFSVEQWQQNPFGTEYRQHKTGLGSLMPLAPSEDAVQIADTAIQKNRKPFKNHEDMMAILKKIENPIDRFGLYTIFMNQPICTAISGTAIRIMNLWEEIKSMEEKKN